MFHKKVFFSNDVRDPFALHWVAKWIVQCFSWTRLLPLSLWVFYCWFFFPNTVIYPIIQMKHASCTTKSSGEMLCNSGSASKKHSSLHAVFWEAAALTDAVGLLDQHTYYRLNGISSNTICLLFMSHFVSKITKGPLEISGDLPKTSFFPSDFFF